MTTREKIRRLHEFGLSDSDIARHCWCGRHAIYRVRIGATIEPSISIADGVDRLYAMIDWSAENE